MQQVPEDSSKKPLALFAGSGDLPRLLVKSCEKQARPLYILAFQGQTESDLVEGRPHLWVHFGEVGKCLKYLKSNAVQEIVLAGGMTRPSLSEIRPDLKGALWLAKLSAKALGDDSFLKLLIQMMEAEGFKIVGADQILQDVLATKETLGTLGSVSPDAIARSDIARGLEILKALSSADVGQAVVIQQGLVLGVEAIEGTDALIKRAGEHARPGEKGILVKIAKTSQDNRADLPTIGPETIKNLAKAGLRGVVIEAGRSLLLHREETIRLADEAGIFIEGVLLS
ncbi:UDP-2,3-diacylglucosamine diphosphatase [Candidatus Bealeia paramacronuclearis]|uniref:UDP-2,3-diacylglucosamine diphosphatase n=1 Tax=Candidatus Bealeia paramacronuclearis TaxID=1921001 RepID=A0ABZ2C3T3_9PROT|nr:UDP-2,3-diacylglucosamine diphosphatase [Candidatus Bealeia paramacronuclearis]